MRGTEGDASLGRSLNHLQFCLSLVGKGVSIALWAVPVEGWGHISDADTDAGFASLSNLLERAKGNTTVACYSMVFLVAAFLRLTGMG